MHCRTKLCLYKVVYVPCHGAHCDGLDSAGGITANSAKLCRKCAKLGLYKVASQCTKCTAVSGQSGQTTAQLQLLVMARLLHSCTKCAYLSCARTVMSAY